VGRRKKEGERERPRLEPLSSSNPLEQIPGTTNVSQGTSSDSFSSSGTFVFDCKLLKV
jgi:hypothetical protein